MKKPLLAALMVATTLPLGACATDYSGDRYGYNNRPRDGYYSDRRDRRDRREDRRGRYLADSDMIYRDNDGHYYCKRSDGSTGTIVGALAGGVLGNIIAPGGSKTLGTVLGAAGGAIAGNAVDKNNVRCE
ncbi:MAG: glycine zipper 2TM domain-containing protein [Sphingobium sp.]|nr:glycine zipper 2TM domain-containing protein [Sphingobium sp.]